MTTPRVLTIVLFGILIASISIADDDEHGELTWDGPGTCIECHTDEAEDVHGSVMYQWQGEAPQMASGPATQGKISGGVNSYCINILGNWNVCGNCHVGLGAMPGPDPVTAELENIDCLICHQQAYRRKKVNGSFVPDTDAMGITMDEAVQTVHEPVRFNCLQCHAKAGGGDAVKRGDLSLAHASTGDEHFDVHMATGGGDLQCQECHTVSDHRFAGRGSDLRPTDSAAILECTNCHAVMATPDGHEGSTIDRHVGRLACQTCHIPIYAKDAADSDATEATETYRTWLASHSTQPPYHPAADTANDLVPEYRFWNRRNNNYLLYDTVTRDPVTGRYPTSRPIGHVTNRDSKLYPFKYKTAQQPITNATNQLIALDTSVYFASGDASAAVEQGLVNMGIEATEPYSWIETDTFQMLNHEVSPDGDALRCGDCHGSSARMNLQRDFGYGLRGPESDVCFQCHGAEEDRDFEEIHEKHVKDKGYDCSWCHGFSRPELGLEPSPMIFVDLFESGDLLAWSP
jgi:hypothetical protein